MCKPFSFLSWLSFAGIALVLGFVMPANATITPHPLFTDNMVLQQGMEIPVWGWADEGESVTVTLGDQSAQTTTQNGQWMVRLGKQPAGGPLEMKIKGNNEIVVKNVLVGEVWVCSGQSNMQMNVQSVDNAEEEINNANYPNIHLFSVPLTASRLPQKNVDGQWSVCTPETIPGFSAVAYFFGRDLHKALNVPVGLIHSSWGGSACEAWVTRETLESDLKLKILVDRWDKIAQEADASWGKYMDELNEWRQQANQREEKGERYVGPPQAPRYDNRNSNSRSSALYNAMIAPLVPYSIQGAIWYQGETNAGRAYQYRNLFPTLIQDWRKQWGNENLSFHFVQLANFQASRDGNDTWPELREAQTMTLSVPKTGMAVTLDIGNPTDIHPRNKQDVGYRLALAARKVTYGEDIVYSGPLYKSMKVEEGKIRLNFDCVGSGLTTKGNEPLLGFTIAGEDKHFVPAGARIEGDSVIVWSDDVTNPVAVRYAWQDYPTCNLFNKDGLPASSFRTDDWPGLTINNE